MNSNNKENKMQNDSKQVAVKIIIPKERKGGFTLVNGTKVLTSSGDMLPVSRIVLTGEVNDIWRAEVTMLVTVDEGDVHALATEVGNGLETRDPSKYLELLKSTPAALGLIILGIIVAVALRSVIP